VGSGPTTPQTDAALSPRLLEILQYREQTHKRTLSDTTPLNVDRRTVAGSLPERPASTVGYQTPRQHTAGGIMQILDAVDEGRNSQPIPLPARSETPDTIESDVIWPTASTIPHQENLNQVPKSRKNTLDPPESTATTSSTQTGDSIPSDTSSFTIVDGSEYQRHTIPTPPDARTDRRVRDVKKSQGVDDVRRVDDTRNDHGPAYPRSNRGEGGVREVRDAKKSGPQRPESPAQQTGTYGYDPPTLPSVKTDRNPAVLNIKPVERTQTQGSGVEKKSKRTIPTCDHTP